MQMSFRATEVVFRRETGLTWRSSVSTGGQFLMQMSFREREVVSGGENVHEVQMFDPFPLAEPCK